MDTSPTSPRNVRVEVENFGPIRSGAVDLRPLTVFVGPSNTGKTYLATLIYALHRVFGGIDRLPLSHEPRFQLIHRFGFGSKRFYADFGSIQGTKSALKKLTTQNRPFRFSDLPKKIREGIKSEFTKPDGLDIELENELRRCFDVSSMADLERWSRNPEDMAVSLKIDEASQRLWQFNMISSRAKVSTEGKIEDFALISEKSEKNRWAKKLQRSDPFFWEAFVRSMSGQETSTYYLPSARSGIMQSHRVIASSTVARSTRAGIDHIQILTLSGVTSDFIQRLILYPNRKPDDSMENIVQLLEQEILAGQIRTIKSPLGGYPEFVYRPRGSKQDISLTRASSMVSELAPVVLFLRGDIDIGDTLIIEEPEAHLHPAAQTEVAATLARLVRLGIRVLVTTHSDWLLQEIGNLIREGELRGCHPESTPKQSAPSAWLRQEEVGAWLFRQDGRASGSKVVPIPFDLVEGINPPGYEEVAEMLYNRSIRLQNRLTKATDNDERT